MGNRRKVPLSEQQRLDKQSLHTTYEQKRVLSSEDYAAWCRVQCVEHGLQSNAQRSKVWLDLLLHEERSDEEAASGGGGVGSSTIPYWSPATQSNIGDEDLVPSSSPMSRPNCHEHVMNCDISRSLWHVRDEHREERRRQLKTVLMRCLLHHPELHYYQGLHELVGAVLSVVGDYLPFESQVVLIDLLVKRRWHVFCHASLKCSESLLVAVHRVLESEDKLLGQALVRSGVGPSTHYALPWVITWFTHHHTDAEPILCRLFDFLVGSSSPHSIVAVAASLILLQKSTVIEVIGNDDDEDGDGDNMTAYAMAFTMLTKLPNALLEPVGGGGGSGSNVAGGALDGSARIEVDDVVHEAQRLLARHGLAIQDEISSFQSQQGLASKETSSTTLALSRGGVGLRSIVKSVSMMLLLSVIGVANYLVITGPGVPV